MPQIVGGADEPIVSSGVVGSEDDKSVSSILDCNMGIRFGNIVALGSDPFVMHLSVTEVNAKRRGVSLLWLGLSWCPRKS